jgi:5-carboxymethyl-2-hydroxymuconic-semialdehyde dehydrogenase
MPHTALVEGVEVDTRHWIGGRRVASASGATVSDVSPIDEAEIAQVSAGSEVEAAAAVAAAQEAFPGWAATTAQDRAEILHRVADGVEKRLEDLARVETRDNGSLIRSHRRGVMPRVALNFRFFADHLRRVASGAEHADFETRGHRNHVSWDPAGVTAIITPWNAPLMLATWRIGPALAAGNTVVAKPPEWAPLTASLLADITAEAGLPDGVFNVVQGLGADAGAPLVADPRVRRICFTGSVPTSRSIGASAAANVTPVSFELGGKSPLVVLEDADLDLAVSLAVEQFDNSGQVCLAAVRLLVHSSLADAFLERFLARAAQIRQGDPRDESTDIGPLVSRKHFERVSGFVERALADGATALLGGGPNTDLNGSPGAGGPGKGLYFRPTLLTGATLGSEILCEEVFGPVLTFQTFDTESAAVALANSTDYGLAATLVTGDPERAERVAAQLSAGTVWVNCFFVRDLRAPFGGNGRSGIGREGGTWSFDFYCDVKNTCYSPNGWSADATPADSPWGAGWPTTEGTAL